MGLEPYLSGKRHSLRLESNMKDTTKRTCGLCGVDQTPLGKGLSEVRNPKGHGVGLVGDCCWQKAREMIDTLASQHGAYIVNGNYLSSPMGTPDVRSFDELKAAIKEN